MLSKKTFEILKNQEMHVYDRDKQDGEYYRSVEFYSSEGEDVLETIWYDGTDEGFRIAFKENAESFDIDKHAAMWIDCRGKNGVPESIKALIDDAEWIKNKLLEVSKELEGNLSVPECSYNNSYNKKYVVVCYSVHNKEIASYNTFNVEDEAYGFLNEDAQNTYEEELNNSSDKSREQIDFTISDDGTAYLSSCNGEYEWTWEVITIN